MSDIFKDERYKIKIYFTDNIVYEIDTNDNTEKSIINISVNEEESVSSGNPIGIISSNSLYIEMYDKTGAISIYNKKSPYYNYMKNGVKIELYVVYKEYTEGDVLLEIEELYGVYYTTDWDTPYSSGSGNVTTISAQDKIQYIGSKEIPKLPTYSGVSIRDLIKQVFNGIGITDDEYSIDESLDMNIPYGITVGIKVRDFLNEITQVLLARVHLQGNIINIVPALGTYKNSYVLEDGYFNNMTIGNNTDNTYTKIRLYYDKVGNSEIDTIATINNITLTTGLNEFNSIKFNSKVFSISQVYVEAPKVYKNKNVSIGDINWTAYQDGMDIKVYNNTGINVDNVNIIIEGLKLNTTEATAELTIEDSEVPYILDLTNSMIQDTYSATKLVSDIAKYLRKMKKTIQTDTQLTIKAQPGDRLQIKSSNPNYSGYYRIIGCKTNLASTSYSKVLTLIYE